jgi:alpha-L-fucosidase
MKMKRKLPVPTAAQLSWHDMEIGMFIHWAPNVYHETQQDQLITPLELINPFLLDAEEWVKNAQVLGAKYIVLVAKHSGGFCLWQTDTTPYSIKNTPWRGGKGDIVRDVSEACKRYGIKLGIYLSPMDHFLGAKVGGLCTTLEKQQIYNRIYRQQLEELLSSYGPFVELWFDGSTCCEIGDIIKKYSPEIIVFQSKHANIRWVGNEMGMARYPAWNSVPKKMAESGIATILDSTPEGDVWMPLECDTPIRKDWFWSENNLCTLKSLDYLMKTYYNSVGNGAVLLLNANPDRTGCIPPEDAGRISEFGDTIRKLHANCIAQTSGEGRIIDLELNGKKKIDHIIIMEDIAFGERVRKYVIEGFNGKEWNILTNGTAIGHKKIEQICGTEVSKVRFTATRYAQLPKIRALSVYYSELPFVGGIADYPKEDFLKVHQWGEEMFYGNELLKHEIVVDLSGILTEVQDVGQYLVQLQDHTGDVRILEAHLKIDGQFQPEYIRLQSDSSLTMYIPGVDTILLLRLVVELPGMDSQGIVLIKKL